MTAFSSKARLAQDRQTVADKFPPDTVEREVDGNTVWFYAIDNELGQRFEFATFFDGSLYQSMPIKPVGLEKIVQEVGGHASHYFTDGYCCLGANGGGAPSLAEAWAKTAMWAYNMAGFLGTGHFLFLNK